MDKAGSERYCREREICDRSDLVKETNVVLPFRKHKKQRTGKSNPLFSNLVYKLT